MKNLFITSAILLASLYIPYYGFSQEIGIAVDMEQIDGNNENLANLKNDEFINSAILVQLGDENSAFIKQAGLNTITAKQVGIQNSLYLIHSNFGGQFTLNQNGDLNHYNGELNGTHIEALITQNGNSNTINQQVSGDHLLYEIIQEGQHNSISHTSNKLSSSDLKIQQRGNKMQLIIKSN
ncbi:hypothetical protein QYS49_36845 [Marivirga salinae]|uniref:Curlin associated repeat-containing protein n=1 Tax=Marivirga salinarum TaxID=3059078 RepID=A0AA51RAD0_9BACT|nr:hypothetical protein [Marivirga sp. BDSF4-3]WMN11011.1 hypothetical protein QYS49_36845 [Marivirga sp. BDSF4-3]